MNMAHSLPVGLGFVTETGLPASENGFKPRLKSPSLPVKGVGFEVGGHLCWHGNPNSRALHVQCITAKKLADC